MSASARLGFLVVALARLPFAVSLAPLLTRGSPRTCPVKLTHHSHCRRRAHSQQWQPLSARLADVPLPPPESASVWPPRLDPDYDRRLLPRGELLCFDRGRADRHYHGDRADLGVSLDQWWQSIRRRRWEENGWLKAVLTAVEWYVAVTEELRWLALGLGGWLDLSLGMDCGRLCTGQSRLRWKSRTGVSKSSSRPHPHCWIVADTSHVSQISTTTSSSTAPTPRARASLTPSRVRPATRPHHNHGPSADPARADPRRTCSLQITTARSPGRSSSTASGESLTAHLVAVSATKSRVAQLTFLLVRAQTGCVTRPRTSARRSSEQARSRPSDRVQIGDVCIDGDGRRQGGP